MKSITVFCKDYVGLVADISELIGKSHINIRSIQAEQVGGNAVIRLETDRADEALKVLNEAGFPAMSRECVLVKIENKPGTLAKVSRALAEATIEIRGINVIQQDEEYNVVAIISNDDEKTREILESHLIH